MNIDWLIELKLKSLYPGSVVPLAMFWTTLRISLDVLKVEMFVKCAVPKVLSCWFYSTCHLIKVLSWRHTSKFLPSRIHFSAGVSSKNWVRKLMNNKNTNKWINQYVGISLDTDAVNTAQINIQGLICLRSWNNWVSKLKNDKSMNR